MKVRLNTTCLTMSFRGNTSSLVQYWPTAVFAIVVISVNDGRSNCIEDSLSNIETRKTRKVWWMKREARQQEDDGDDCEGEDGAGEVSRMTHAAL